MAVSHASPGAMVYAKALFEAVDAAGGDQLLREVDTRLQRMRAAWTEISSLRGYFLSATVSLSDREASLDKLTSTVPPLLRNFLRLLLRRGRLVMVDEIAIAYEDLLNERLGRIQVTLTTATPVAEDDFRQWTDQIRTAIGGEPLVQHVVNSDIVAGAIIRVGDRVIDGCARRKLAALHENIIQRGKQTHALQS